MVKEIGAGGGGGKTQRKPIQAGSRERGGKGVVVSERGCKGKESIGSRRCTDRRGGTVGRPSAVRKPRRRRAAR